MFPRQPLANRTVLVVDDHPGLAEMFADAVRQAGGHAVVAHQAAGALEALRTHQVDALVSDLRMPGMTGFDLIKVVRASRASRVRALPAIAVSGDAEWSFQDPFEAARAGFDFHLAKPVAPEALVQMVANVLTWKRRQTP